MLIAQRQVHIGSYVLRGLKYRRANYTWLAKRKVLYSKGFPQLNRI